jgi:hypothetical protein
MKSEKFDVRNIVYFERHWPYRRVSGFRQFSLLLIDLSLQIHLVTGVRFVKY